MRNSQSAREITAGRMRILTAGNLLVFSGLCLGFRIEDFLGQNVFENNYDYQHQLTDDFANERQDIQSPDVLIPAFIATFIASSITNLLFPRVPLIVASPPSSTTETPPPPPTGQGLFFPSFFVSQNYIFIRKKKYFSL